MRLSNENTTYKFHPKFSGGHLTYITTLLKLQDSFKECKLAVAVPKSSDIYQSLKKKGIFTFECDSHLNEYRTEPFELIGYTSYLKRILQKRF